MAPKGSVYSQTLHDITNTKLDELAKKRKSFEKQSEQISALTLEEQDAAKKLAIMAENMKTCFSIVTSKGGVVRGSSNHSRLEIDLGNIDRFLAQARYDPSVSPKVLEQWRDTMVRHLEIQSLKYTYASLYGQLTTEWLSSNQDPVSTTQDEDAEMKDFEHVSTAKKIESRRKWEDSVFHAVEIDRSAVTELLHSLFESTPEDSKHLVKALRQLRDKVADFEQELARPESFNRNTLTWIITGLIASDLLDDEKRAALRDFMANPTILNEIADVLNMRMAALEDWSWGDEVLLEQRRKLNGSFNIYMHEDLLQAIFLQYIGVRWSVFWKQAFANFRKSNSVWKTSRTSIDPLDRKRRDYFLGAVSETSSNVDSKRQDIYRKSYFVSQLLDYETQKGSTEEGDEEAELETMAVQKPQGRARQSASGYAGAQATHKRKVNKTHNSIRQDRSAYAKQSLNESDEVEMADADEGVDDENDKPNNPMEAKQNLFHLLSTEILIKTRLHGELTCFRSQVDNLYPSLPHSTIAVVLSFFGVSQKWLNFLTRFLKAPLKFQDDDSSGARQRQTGTPGSHVLSEVFAETILFVLDFQINQETNGELLWRMQDDFWFWSSNHATCVKAWSIVQRFIKAMGLGLNNARTGAVRMSRKSDDLNRMVPLDVGNALPRGEIRWGMLHLKPESGRFEIDQELVDHHIDELSRQLKDKTSKIFAWIQAWNSYAATFFTSNFGKPANCFGRQHVDNMLATHERIQRQLFKSSAGTRENSGGGSVIEFLKRTIEQRFGVKDIPDGYFYFPAELGGLDVRNPFIGLLQIRDAVKDDPNNLLEDFEEAEKEAYRAAKIRFENWRAGNMQDIHVGIQDPGFEPKDSATFFSFEEYTKYREALHYGFTNELAEVFTTLLAKPQEQCIKYDSNGEVVRALTALGGTRGPMGILSDWWLMEPYWMWVAQLYGPEMIDKFGGFQIVEPSWLPMGMVSEFRSGRVDWQE